MGPDLLGFAAIGLKRGTSDGSVLPYVEAVARGENTLEHLRSGDVPRTFVGEIQRRVAADWVALTDAEPYPSACFDAR